MYFYKVSWNFLFLFSLIGICSTQRVLPKADQVGDPCESDTDCVILGEDFSACIEHKCGCKQGEAVPSEDLRQCLPIVNLIGGACLENLQCKAGLPGKLSQCENNICSCNENSVREPGQHQCLKTSEFVGEACTSHIQCKTTLGDLSSCTGSVCICGNGAVIGEDSKFCLPIRNMLGQECQEDQQCKSGAPGALSECTGPLNNKTCECGKDGIRIISQHFCHKKAEFVDEACSVNEQCEANLGGLAMCPTLTRKCRCSDRGGVPSDNNKKCLLRVDTLDAPCEEDRQCQWGTPGGWSECSSLTRTCVCKENAVHVHGLHKCYKKVEFVDEACEVREQCVANLGQFAECPSRNWKCNCGDRGGVPSDDNQRCLPRVDTLDGECEQNRQCQWGTPGEWSHCSQNGTCACQENAVNVHGNHKCYKKVDFVDQSCEVREQCVANLGEFVQCPSRNWKCTCSDGGGVPSDDNQRCLQRVDILGGACEEDRQCQWGTPGGWSQCSQNGTCACQENAVNVHGYHKCYKKVDFVDEACEVREQCVANLGEYAECATRNWKCNCNDRGGVATENNKRCLPKQNLLGGECEQNIQCQSGTPGVLSYCHPDLKICMCTEAVNIPCEHKCLPSAKMVGDSCQNDVQCKIHVGATSVCYRNACICAQSDRKPMSIPDKLQFKLNQIGCKCGGK